MKLLDEYDQIKLSEARAILVRIYEYNYSQSSHDKVSRRLETILKKIDELADLEKPEKPIDLCDIICK